MRGAQELWKARLLNPGYHSTCLEPHAAWGALRRPAAGNSVAYGSGSRRLRKAAERRDPRLFPFFAGLRCGCGAEPGVEIANHRRALAGGHRTPAVRHRLDHSFPLSRGAPRLRDGAGPVASGAEADHCGLARAIRQRARLLRGGGAGQNRRQDSGHPQQTADSNGKWSSEGQALDSPKGIAAPGPGQSQRVAGRRPKQYRSSLSDASRDAKMRSPADVAGGCVA